MLRKNDLIWTDEIVADLRRLKVVDGVSNRKIAILLNLKYHTNLTRNAVCGKCDRLGLRGPKIIYPSRKKPKRRKLPGNGKISRTRKPPAFKPARLETNTPEPKPIGTSEAGTGCQWIHGDYPHIRFCDHERREGSSYCAHHHQRCYVPREQQEHKRRAVA